MEGGGPLAYAVFLLATTPVFFSISAMISRRRSSLTWPAM